MTKARTAARSTRAEKDYPFAIRNSKIAGKGAFATRKIRKGQRVIEYVGEIISQKQSDLRYPDDDPKGNHHTFLFELDKNRVIDATYGGNDSRFINHSCDPNCEALDDKGKIVIYAMKTIQPGEELAYDYAYARTRGDTALDEAKYPCRCGAENCRGTILEAKKEKKKKKKTKKKTAKSASRKSVKSKKKTTKSKKRATRR